MSEKEFERVKWVVRKEKKGLKAISFGLNGQIDCLKEGNLRP